MGKILRCFHERPILTRGEILEILFQLSRSRGETPRPIRFAERLAQEDEILSRSCGKTTAVEGGSSNGVFCSLAALSTIAMSTAIASQHAMASARIATEGNVRQVLAPLVDELALARCAGSALSAYARAFHEGSAARRYGATAPRRPTTGRNSPAAPRIRPTCGSNT